MPCLLLTHDHYVKQECFLTMPASYLNSLLLNTSGMEYKYTLCLINQEGNHLTPNSMNTKCDIYSATMITNIAHSLQLQISLITGKNTSSAHNVNDQ